MDHLSVVDMATFQLAGGTVLQLPKAHSTRVLFLLKHLVSEDTARSSSTAGDTGRSRNRDATRTLQVNSQYIYST